MGRVIYTVVIGQAIERLARLTLPRMQRYADRCGADLVIYQKNTTDGPHFSKFDAIIQGYERGYEQLLFLDADILVANDDEDIFNEYTCALHDESVTPVGEPSRILACAFAEIRRNFDPDFTPPYYNSGVMLFDRQTMEPLAKRLQEIERIRLVLWDQCQLNWHLRVIGAPAQNMAAKWNYQYSWTQRDGRTVFPDDLRFLHFCGTEYGAKTPMVQQVCSELGIRSSDKS